MVSKSTQILNITKILLVGAELFQPGVRKDTQDESKSRFSPFCECDFRRPDSAVFYIYYM
jgi:hypothetical protein